MASALEDALQKIRPHTSSSLPHQKTPATLLAALEATLDEQSTERSPTAYFASLLTTLDSTIHKDQGSGIALGDGDVLPAELYLLALVAPFVPPAVIRAQISTITSLIAPLWPSLYSHAPPLRSQLTLFGAILQALDRSQLEIPALRQSFASILQLCMDARPKVRRKAADVVRDLLATPPPPLACHPYADKVADWIKNALENANASPLAKGKAKKQETEGSEAAVHLLAFLRPILPKLPPSVLPQIASSLLTLPRLGNPYLSQSSYSILSDLLSSPPEEDEDVISPQIPNILKAVLSSPPSKADASLCPAWLLVIGNAMIAYQRADSSACAAELGKVWKVVWGYLESSDAPTRKAAAESLHLLAQCFSQEFVKPALKNGKGDAALNKIIAQATAALDSLTFARSMPDLLAAVGAVVANLRRKVAGDRTAVEALATGLIEKVGALRTQKGFEHKEAVDAVLGTAMQVVGPEVLLHLLPLNLEPADRKANREPRAFLLPLLPHAHPSPLTHFIAYFVPLSERMFDYQQKAEDEGRPSEAKVWSVLVAQIWAGLVGYCHGGGDLSKGLTPQFSQLLSQLLYSQEELRPYVLKAIKVLLDSNLALSSADEADIDETHSVSRAQAQANVAFLRTQAESWLAVLFNVFSTASRDGRALIGDVISAWLRIADDVEVGKSYVKVVGLFTQNLAKPSTHGAGEGSVASVTLDLLALLVPFLSAQDANALFEVCLSPEVLAVKDTAVQKRGYKILARLAQSGKVPVDAAAVLARLGGVADALHAAAKKDRFSLLEAIVPLIPPIAMHLMPSLIPEAILGTKEPAEKARNAAFDLLVAMGKKMSEGGVVKRAMVDGMEEDGPTEAPASIEEYMTMIAGGLAGATPHMISATVTAISRVVFEFKDAISENMHSEIFTTLLVFLSSANREIVKSTLGYVKLAIHTLPAELLRPHLQQLVLALLGWVHDHKNHFKPKVRHMFERLLRRFPFEEVYACAGEDEARKVLVNIKKRKDRAKRKRTTAVDEDEDEAPRPKATTGDAFEDVLYGSESELEDSDEEVDEDPKTKRKGAHAGARLRIDDDEPMDLLQGAASRITGANARRKKPGQDAARYKTDEETGKMMIDENDSDEDAAPGEDVVGTAYREALTSADGFTRGANGRVKFNKDTKKRRRENEDVEMADLDEAALPSPGKKNKSKRTEQKLGHEFKAKKAGGDVKKGGVDPYAYLSLSQAAKRKGGKSGRIGIAGKR